MATRKSGDGSPRDDSDRPGSYAKSSGSRRKRKGKKNRDSLTPSGRESSLPPELSDQSAELPIAAIDVEGEEVERDGGRLTRPDFGEAPTRDFSVDDLRRKGGSSRAPRKQLGPLGMEEAPAEASSVPPRRPSTPRPSPRPSAQSGRLNVVEINTAGQTSDNTNSDRFEPAHDDPFGDPFEHEPESEPPLPPPARPSSAALPQRSIRPYEPQHALDDALHEAEVAGRPSMSSVFGARASIRPSPPPPKLNSVSVLWWVVVSLLSAIIVAAGVIALREAKQGDRTAHTKVVPEASPEPAPKPETERVAPAPALAKVPAPTVTPMPTSQLAQPAQAAVAKPAPVAPAPIIKPVVTATPVATPVVAPAEAKPKPSAPVIVKAATPVPPRPRMAPKPHVPEPAATDEVAQETVAAPAAAPEPEPAPARAPGTAEERLPQNPYN